MSESDGICESCGGLGWVDVGDPENGVTQECPTCEGTGKWSNQEEPQWKAVLKKANLN